MQPTANRSRLALVALVVLALIWGYNWVVVKIAVHDAPPFVFAAMRTLGGGIALLVAGIAMRRRILPAFPMQYFWIGFFQTGVFLGLVTWAIVAAGAGEVAILAYTMPLWVSLIAWPLLGERLNAMQGLAIAIAFVGIACMVGFRHAPGLPEVLAVLAGLCWAVGIIIAKRLQMRERVDLFSMTMWQLIFGGIVLTIVAAVIPEHAVVWNVPYVLAVAYNVILATAVAYFLWLFILRELPARDASMGTLANPIVGVLAAWIQLGERPGVLTAVGMLLVLGGLVLLAKAESSAVQSN